MRSTTRRPAPSVFCLIAVCLLAGGCVQISKDAQPSPDQETAADHLALAALLIRDRHFARAEAVLRQIDEAQEGLDTARLHTLRGLVALARRTWPQAKTSLLAAIAAGQKEPVTWVYLAQAHYGLEDHAATLAALDRAGAAAAEMPEAHRMRVDCLWRTKQRAAAFDALAAADARFPNDSGFAKQRLLYLLHLGLYREATRAGQTYLSRAKGSARAYLALGEALRRARQHDAASRVLETARLRYPSEEQIQLALAHAHLDAGRPRAAGKLLEAASLTSPKLISEAAELFRRGGDLRRALYLNGLVADQKAKTRQRLGILLQLGRVEQASSLEPRISRLGLLEDEQVRYALAYAHYRCGDLDKAADRLRGITKPNLFQAATDLRKAIETRRQTDQTK